MIPSTIEREHVLEALGRIDRDGVPKGRGSRSYLLLHDDRTYPPKYTVALAAEVATGQFLSSDDFGGGKETNGFLLALGFVIVGKDGNPISSPASPPTPKATPTPGPKTTQPVGHDERCSECKNTIADFLRVLYGTTGVVRREHKLALQARLEAYAGHPRYDDLRRVYEALQAHRGHDNFVKTATIRPLDIFVDPPGFIVELDEGQHFTAARDVALGAYPDDIALGFDREGWMQLCRDLRRADPDPPYRDEQRAWYDTVRDFAPALRGGDPLGCTVRIQLGQVAWCKLDPGRPEDIERFVELVPGLPGQPTPRQHRQSSDPRLVEEHLQRGIAAMQDFEWGMQEIRLCYLRWVSHPEFTPPNEEIAGLLPGDKFPTLWSPNGNGFTLSPCGWGSFYAGGGRGSVRAPEGMWPEDPELVARTTRAKADTGDAVRRWRAAVRGVVDLGDMDEAWALVQDYFWVKVGVHEFAADLVFGVPWGRGSVRDLLIDSMRRGEDLRESWPTTGFDPDDLLRFVRYTNWNRYACCAFDCGPLAQSREGFVRYSEVAKAIPEVAPGPDGYSKDWAVGVLTRFYDPVQCLGEPPFELAETFGGLKRVREGYAEHLGSIEASLRRRVR